MNRQRIISTNLGNDTHVRNHNQNAFTANGYSTTQMLAGEILMPEPEPLFKQNMVSVRLARGGVITSVAYPGAFIDPITGNLHGVYEGPIPGQMVAVGFENGNRETPFVVNRYPYQGCGNTLFESKYFNPLTRKLFHSFDVLIGHFSGSYLSFNTGILPSIELPGSITLSAMTDLNLISNTNIIMDGLFIQLNGKTDFAVKWTALNTILQKLVSDFNLALASKKNEAGSPGTVTLDLTSAKNSTVLM
jgi:hypothetical protein